MPRRQPRKIPAPSPRRRKSDGSSRKGFLSNAPQGIPEIRPPRVIRDYGPEVKRKALSVTAENLLIELSRRLAFAIACKYYRAPVGWAGDKILGVGQARAYEIRREQDTPDGANPLAWFRKAVLDGMRRGKIARGRDTAQSDLADAFFTALGGGIPGIKDIRHKYMRQSSARLDEVNKELKEHEVEVSDYLVHSFLIYRVMRAEETRAPYLADDELYDPTEEDWR
jgi:hypothetical protein